MGARCGAINKLFFAILPFQKDISYFRWIEKNSSFTFIIL